MTFPGTFFSRRSSALPRRSSGAEGTHSFLQHPPSPAYSEWSWEDQYWAERFDAFLETHLCDSRFDIPLIAEEFAMSDSTLLRQVKRLLHTTPSSYLRQKRLMRAYHLIRQNPSLSI